MIAKDPNQTAICSPPLRRTLFNKPSWSRPQALSSDTDLFHRSNQTYADLAAEAERARKRKFAKKAREKDCQYAIGESAGKRRRVSEDEDNEDDDSSSDGSADHSSPREIKTGSPQSKKNRTLRSRSPQEPIHSPKSLLKRYEAKIDATKVGQEQKPKPEIETEPEPKFSYIIDLEDEEASALPGQLPTCTSVVDEPAALNAEDNEPASDDEFPELARQAREKARRKRLEEDIASRTANPQDEQVTLHGTMPLISQSDPVLHILVTSSIDNTVPLIVSRRLSQRLKDVRLTWTKRQNFTSEFTDTVFLTWRGKRVFDVTTCRSLGISVDAVGSVSTKGDSSEEEGAQIHLEAMTPRILEAYKKAKRIETSGQDDVAAKEEAMGAKDNESQFRIILKAKGLADFKLQVRPVCHLCGEAYCDD